MAILTLVVNFYLEPECAIMSPMPQEGRDLENIV
jgi:hypothetical protein